MVFCNVKYMERIKVEKNSTKYNIKKKKKKSFAFFQITWTIQNCILKIYLKYMDTYLN